MIERSPERDAALRAMLPQVPEFGWTEQALQRGLARAGLPVEDAPFLFPAGPIGMVEAFSDLADRDMEAAALAESLSELRVPARIRRVIALRLQAAQPHKAALRRGLGLLALPWNLRVALRCTARTVDSMWHAAGDTSADFSWYTRRASLAAVYATTLAFWLANADEDLTATLGFLDRRLAGLARMSRRPAAQAA
ncbi:ubiquinone biosynthesis protein COQ9 [Humitalea rosea]|uniref:Ubiquinone biosynthesis protein COQ9 n=1 Tax=Humitalea rosea TaxID=990373 RepID=A0A2W7IJ75_9PROT|nr:COQ9 family protein [Humitalea rosea]PZW46748.1 ubiquinone biosynthesis protein COQ9 [Humitalea rosea]